MGEGKRTYADMCAEGELWMGPPDGGGWRLRVSVYGDTVYFSHMKTWAEEHVRVAANERLAVSMAHAILRHYGEE